MVVTLVGAGIAGYLFYKGIQARISPDAIRIAAEETLTGLVRQPVSVDSAKVGIANNLLSLERVRISSATGALVSVEKLEAYAEGGMEGLQQGRFARIVVTNPVVSLQRKDGEWNLTSFLSPLLRGPVGGIVSESTAEAAAEKGMPLTLVEVFGLELTVTLEDGTTYSGVSLDNLVLSRDGPDMAWQVHIRDASLRLNPSADEWPLLEATGCVRSLIAAGDGISETDTSGSVSDQHWLANVAVENVSIELVHPKQVLSVGGLSFSAENFLKLIRLRTGSLEKKSLVRAT
jgi:hypothetical protein